MLDSGFFPDVWSEGIDSPLFNAVPDSGCFPDAWSEGIVSPLFNAVLDSGCFPDVWSEGIVSPLFNAVLDSGCFPDVWSEGIVSPLFKKGDVANYRAITLLSSLSKLFTIVINKRISSCCDKYNTVSDAQFGFRKGSSNTDATFVLLSLVLHYLNINTRLFVAFIDLKKIVLISSIVMLCGTV